MGASDRLIVLGLLGLGACALGATACSGAEQADFAVDAAGSARDATTSSSSSGGMGKPMPLSDAVASSDDSGATVDSGAAVGVVDAAVDAAREDEAGGEDGGGPSFCSRICMGCCNAMGKCVIGNTVASCGTGGASCGDCSTHKCPLTESPCCGNKGCGCAVAGILGCN